jgi:RsmE family RNA methyltransferase
VNLILLFDDDFVSESRVRLTGRRLEHVANVHRAAAGDTLVVGKLNGGIGRGVVTSLGEALELEVTFDSEPPAPLPLTLVLALPRPKVLNRTIASATSLGVKRIFLVNAWRVEKSYWKSPRVSEANLFEQSVLGLEQARDTTLPSIELRRFFRPFADEELPRIASDTLALVAHPRAAEECPRHVERAVTLVVGPEGGFIEEEVASLERAGCTPVNIGTRILRVETAVTALIARLF